MTLELIKDGLTVEVEKAIAVYYGPNVVGTFSADLVVERKIILELKATDLLHAAHEAQLTNYLRATDMEIGLLFNFGQKPAFKRKYFANSNKRRDGPESKGILTTLLRNDPPKSA